MQQGVLSHWTGEFAAPFLTGDRARRGVTQAISEAPEFLGCFARCRGGATARLRRLLVYAPCRSLPHGADRRRACNPCRRGDVARAARPATRADDAEQCDACGLRLLSRCFLTATLGSGAAGSRRLA